MEALFNLQLKTIAPEDFYDVVIIGGGPHALGVAARLREPRPAALYNDIEHSRLSFLRRPGIATPPRQPKRPYQLRPPPLSPHAQALGNGHSMDPEQGQFPRLLVLDASSSTWLGRWNGFFDHLSISHLRSPMFFHPGPADVDGLEAFAKRIGEEGSCEESGGVESVLPTVGQSHRGLDKVRTRATKKKASVGPKGCASKSLLGAPINERERSSYARPSSRVFREFCEQEVVERYGLGPTLRHEEVVGLSYGLLHVKTEGHGHGFTLTCRGGKQYGAKYVVMSIGGQELPAMPKCLLNTAGEATDCNANRVHQGPGWCHSKCFSYGGTDEFKRAVKLSASRQGSIVVIGGGLTSAQIADLAIRKGASRVIFLCRGFLKTKHYDFPLSWVTKYSNLEKMSFWQEDCRKVRLKMVKQARNGGSVNPSTLNLLKRRVAEGTLILRNHTTVEQACRDATTGRWTLQLRCQPPDLPENASPPQLERVDEVLFIVAATGGKLDFASVPFVSSLLKAPPQSRPEGFSESKAVASQSPQVIQLPGVVEGFPLLTEDLQWGKELPLFVMGAFAALELGPDAANLSGSRSGAERVVTKLNELLTGDWFINAPFPKAAPLRSNLKEGPEAKMKDSPMPTEATTAEGEGPQETVSRLAPGRSKPRALDNRKMGARERRAGNVGGWFDGLEEVEA